MDTVKEFLFCHLFGFNDHHHRGILSSVALLMSCRSYNQGLVRNSLALNPTPLRFRSRAKCFRSTHVILWTNTRIMMSAPRISNRRIPRTLGPGTCIAGAWGIRSSKGLWRFVSRDCSGHVDLNYRQCGIGVLLWELDVSFA